MGNQKFVYLFKERREDWLKDITPEEEAVMEAHYHYVKALFENGKIVMAGPCLNGKYGIVVFTADSPEDAHELYSNDPVVKNNLLDSELLPYHVTFINENL